jgi:hypothetical protein
MQAILKDLYSMDIADVEAPVSGVPVVTQARTAWPYQGKTSVKFSSWVKFILQQAWQEHHAVGGEGSCGLVLQPTSLSKGFDAFALTLLVD